jgi:hypothetical protein
MDSVTVLAYLTEIYLRTLQIVHMTSRLPVSLDIPWATKVMCRFPTPMCRNPQISSH